MNAGEHLITLLDEIREGGKIMFTEKELRIILEWYFFYVSELQPTEEHENLSLNVLKMLEK